MTTPSTCIIGSTGLVGSHFLSTLLSLEHFNPVNTITRRAPQATSPLLNALVETDTTKWAAALKDFKPAPTAVFSALGTTRAAAGSLANQWKIDHDLNIELAKAAKEAGAKTYVFVSGAGTRGFIAGMSPYCKMKNGVEDAIEGLEFDQAIILKPGLILGQRESNRLGEAQIQTVVRSLGAFASGVKDRLGQEADVIAKAGVRAVQLAGEGKAPKKFWVIDSDEIIRLGRDEWPSKEADAVPAAAPAAAPAATPAAEESKVAAQ